MKPLEDKLITDEMSFKIIETAENLVTANGARNINVRQILKELEITNRVFYNRFHNIDEVLEIVYKNTILKIRQSISTGIDAGKEAEKQGGMYHPAANAAYDRLSDGWSSVVQMHSLIANAKLADWLTK